VNRQPSAPRVPAARRTALHRQLLAWYRRHRRDLPWRRTRDPWAIWVSEVMLQQTQVETARPFYLRFLERFPTPAALARAGQDAVLEAWAGLGYYRRARRLHAAARTVVRDHGGRVPRGLDAFGALAGVGPYTRAAVLSIAYGTPLAVLDGNVARVLSRLFAFRAAVRDPRGARALWSLAQSLVPMHAGGDWNQALMELGATVCTPRAPGCGQCPLRRSCRALALGRVDEFPPVVARRKTERVRRAVALIEHAGGLLVTRRRGKLLEGLWEPPGVELAAGESARPKLRAELVRLGIRARLVPTGKTVRHTITHRAIEVELWRGSVHARRGAARPGGGSARPRDGSGRSTNVAQPREVKFANARSRIALTALARRLVRG
jgi:A/G-specific adenine glycosylase